MADRYSFSSPFGRGGFGGARPWFRVGSLDVTTTVGIVGVGVIWFFVWAIEGPSRSVSKYLWLVSEEAGFGSVTEGQIWRLVTWPAVNEPDFWALLLFAVFYLLGSQLESLMGRRPFLWFLGLLTLVPAVIVTVFELLLPDFIGIAFGLRFVQIGVLVAFAAQWPTARFWPGIPAWGIVVAIVALDFLQAIGDRNDYQLVMLTTTVLAGMVGMRSFGYANDVPWIPKVPLPSAMTGEPAGTPTRPPRRPSRGRNRGRGNLAAVPPTPPNDPIADLEIDALLDQVAERGLDSLSKEQRKQLEDHSKRLRKRRDD